MKGGDDMATRVRKTRLDRRYTKIYGWTEQNSCAWGVHERKIDLVPSEDGVTLMDEGRLVGLDGLGDWFLTFAEAKRAALAHWEEQLEIAREAIRSIRKERKAATE